MLHRYCLLVDRGRLDEVVSLFVPDGSFTLGGVDYVGSAQILGAYQQLADRFSSGPRLRHHLTTVDLDAARSYVLVLGPGGLDHWGHYRDTLVQTPDGWRFAHRHAVVDGATPGSVAEPLVGL